MPGRVGQMMADAGWANYQHQFAGSASRSEKTAGDVQFDTELMRLTKGVSLSSTSEK